MFSYACFSCLSPFLINLQPLFNNIHITQPKSVSIFRTQLRGRWTPDFIGGVKVDDRIYADESTCLLRPSATTLQPLMGSDILCSSNATLAIM